MMIEVPSVLNADEIARCHAIFAAADWADGRITAGHQSAQVKNNQQLPEASPAARQLSALVLSALERSALFVSAVLPERIFPPLFNRYQPGMSFGAHVDNAIRVTADPITGAPVRVRTDVSATLFLSPPASYDGGALVIEDTYGSHEVKLDAGGLIVYPAGSLHHVTPVTRGTRYAAFFWVQSLVRDPGQRALLFDLDMAIIQINQANAAKPDSNTTGAGTTSAVPTLLTGVYHNLLRRWATP
ncbi:MAG TPA: Fe2+-dependent dioxygenase [Polyangia bacterium]